MSEHEPISVEDLRFALDRYRHEPPDGLLAIVLMTLCERAIASMERDRRLLQAVFDGGLECAECSCFEPCGALEGTGVVRTDLKEIE